MLEKLKRLWQNEFIFLDGAMGTMLQSMGLKPGQGPELLCITEPEKVASVHRGYLNAGCDIIYTNTFGANRLKLAGGPYDTAAVVSAALETARSAIGSGGALAALDVGPLGQMLEPAGTLGFEDAYDLFKEIVTAGEAAGADLVVFETMADLYEVKAAVLAARENTNLPIFVTMTFEEGSRTFYGCSLEAMAVTLDSMGVDAFGVNCSQGPEGLAEIIGRIKNISDIALIVKPNAGLPHPETGLFDMTPKQFAHQMRACAELGVQVVGGCCGTTPEFIFELRAVLGGERRARPKPDGKSRLCSAVKTVAVDGARVVGERINPTGNKPLQRALAEGDLEHILRLGIEQAEAGAHILDVNVGMPGIDAKDWMVRAVKGLQSVVELPLQIDSDDPAVIEAGLRTYNGKALVNSVSADAEKLGLILPLIKKYGGAVVGLTMDERGIPETAGERLERAKTIVGACQNLGIPKQDIYIDCLTLPFSAGQAQAGETLKALALVKEQLEVPTILGVSNASFGLPNRRLAAAGFLHSALMCGLDLAIVNPGHPEMLDAIAVFEMLSGADADCGRYIARFSGGPQSPALAEKFEGDIAQAIFMGLAGEALAITDELLKTMDGLEIADTLLIPALDEVGRRFEAGEIFLPQLIKSSQAAGGAFDAIRAKMARAGAPVERGRVLVATVKGDIHDIGKNIAKTVMENYGYKVIDLGRDVPAERVVQTAIDEDIRLVGLSALMTTTLSSMEQTIAALRQSGHECTVFVGGAVLTPGYAAGIGADFYAKDAKASADIAKKVLG
jgi:5-methyltetrahydrofolate--homocysteine methyltransferase